MFMFDRRQTVTLNPQDQARLDQERSIKSRLLGMILGGAQGMGGGGGGQGMPSQGKQGGGQPMPAMNMTDPQQQGPMPQPMPEPQQPMGNSSDMMYDPYGGEPEQSPFGGLTGGGPHGPAGQPSLEEILGRHKGLTPSYMRWK